MYKIKKGIIFNNFSKDLKERLKILGFKEGDNLSEMFQEVLDKKGITLDEYIKLSAWGELDHLNRQTK